MSKIWVLLAAAFVVFILFMAFGPLIFDSTSVDLKIIGRPISSFEKLVDENLETISLDAAIKGTDKERAVLSFWASWCAPCVGELPNIQNAIPDLNKSGILVFLINEDPGPVAKVQAEMLAWKITKKLSFESYYDENSRLLSALGASSLPFHLGVDAGKVRWYAEGEIDWSPSSIEKRFR